MPAQITLPIVGVDYPNRKGPTRRFAVELCEPGDPVELRAEPNNPADKNAIAVFSVEGVQMGYLPAERAPYVGLQIGRGEVRAIYQGRSQRGAFCRIAFGGEEPQLPAIKVQDTEEIDWWPDEEWPD